MRKKIKIGQFWGFQNKFSMSNIFNGTKYYNRKILGPWDFFKGH